MSGGLFGRDPARNLGLPAIDLGIDAPPLRPTRRLRAVAAMGRVQKLADIRQSAKAHVQQPIPLRGAISIDHPLEKAL